MSGKKRPGYWKSYDARHRNNSVRGSFLQLMARVTVLPPPYEVAGHGPEPALSPHEAAALLVLKAHYDLALRDLEDWSEVILGRHVDHSTFHKHFERVNPEYMERVVALLDEEVRSRLQHVAWMFIADSTKVKLDRQYESKEVALEARQVLRNEQLHVLAAYAPQVGVLAVTRANAGIQGEVHALQQEIRTLPPGFLNGKALFADRGYDATSLFHTLFEHGATPLIKQRDVGTARTYRGQAQRVWSPQAYREVRGLVEGIFGGLKTRRALYIRSRKTRNQHRDDLAYAASHNLQSLLRVLTFPETGEPRAG